MLGRTHALTGAACCAAIATTVWHPGAGEAVTAVFITAGAAVLPDIDHPDATVSRSFGVVSWAFAWLVARVSGGHRHGTHSLAGIAAVTLIAAAADAFRHTVPGQVALGVLLAFVLAAALRALRLAGHAADLAGLGWAVALAWTGYGMGPVPWLIGAGAAIHIAGDMSTVSGCPLAWPVSERCCWLLPPRLRLTTGHAPERRILIPVLLLVLVLIGFSAVGGFRLLARAAASRHLASAATCTTSAPEGIEAAGPVWQCPAGMTKANRLENGRGRGTPAGRISADGGLPGREAGQPALAGSSPARCAIS